MSWLVCADNRKARQHRIAVVAVPGVGVATVCHLAPHAVGDELVLGLARPVAIARRMSAMRALHFLEEHDVGRQAVQLVAQLVDDHAPSKLRKSFVDIVGGDREAHAES